MVSFYIHFAVHPNMMNIELLYGKGTLPIQLSPDWEVSIIRKNAMPILVEAKDAILAALANPVNVAPLAREAKGARSACILICDITTAGAEWFVSADLGEAIT